MKHQRAGILLTRIGLKVGEPHGRVTARAEAVAALLDICDSAKVTTNPWGDEIAMACRISVSGSASASACLSWVVGMMMSTP
jgi:hypothetical protein